MQALADTSTAAWERQKAPEALSPSAAAGSHHGRLQIQKLPVREVSRLADVEVIAIGLVIPMHSACACAPIAKARR
eukprot:CAMPEP_0198603566 /NCGR_PEP_ID=MMETSP1462-20131121/152133_1 /TAXON_ID=1333877 /ORGANISM="Brandtodinium nutriculum, Strain RCC3387" /LENGTH=75 /DNA_ID=CAMNT_0044335339 /DNA_START=38 /DNA_END=261 /DNA_ORIENTATION=+